MAKVVLKDINKVYPNGFNAVKGVDLEIDDKEFMILVGPSGCGKTTTLRMIAGLEEISSGDLFIGENQVNDVAPKDRNIAMVFQNYALYPHMSAYENMAFGLKLQKTPKAEIKERIERAAKILAIEKLLTRKPKQLSGGQRQRVALGRAIVRKPEVFLMDEPLSNLDAKLRVQMRAELIKLHNDLATTFIYVTHDQTEAMTMGTRICVMNDGEIQQVAPPKTIYNRPANVFVAGFIGAPQMNFFEGNVESGMLNVSGHKLKPGDELAALIESEAYEGKALIVGVRPENVMLAKGETGIPASVEVTELLGNDLNVYFNLNGKTYTLKTDASQNLKIGDAIRVDIEGAKMHLFDPDTEKSLLY
jgi:multiple sugar transport system ATP-binding protein